MAIVYGLKVNLSVAMVAMLNHTAIKQSNGIHVTTLTLNSSIFTIEQISQKSALMSAVDSCVERGKSETIEVISYYSVLCIQDIYLLVCITSIDEYYLICISFNVNN